eukprot:8246375-Karenia_brevis.AAC.1
MAGRSHQMRTVTGRATLRTTANHSALSDCRSFATGAVIQLPVQSGDAHSATIPITVHACGVPPMDVDSWLEYCAGHATRK